METKSMHENGSKLNIVDNEKGEKVLDKQAGSAGEKKSFLERCRLARSSMTVEPLVLCYLLPSVLSALAVQNLNLEKACRVNLALGEEACDALMQQRGEEDQQQRVQQLVAQLGAWKLGLAGGLPMVGIILAGGWSDRTGRRRPCMLVPLAGEILSTLALMLCVVNWLAWPVEVAAAAEIIPALAGGPATMLMAVFSFLADRTLPEERTFRIGVVNIVISVAVPVGTALSGVLLRVLGYLGVLATCLGVQVLGMLYTWRCLSDLPAPTADPAATPAPPTSCCSSFFSFSHITDTFLVLFKPRPDSRRLMALLVMLCYVTVVGPTLGAGQLYYLYARKKYNFTEISFSIYSSYTIVLHSIGMGVALLLTRRFQVDDCLLASAGCVSKFLASFLYAFSPSRAWFCLAPAVEMIGGTAIIAIRSLATKLVDPDEVGKINSLFGVLDAVVVLVYAPMFAAFYIHTLGVFPGAFNILYGGLILPAAAVFLYMYKITKRVQRKNQASDSKEQHAYHNQVTAM